MNGELIILLVPIGFCTLILTGIGISQWNSKKPVGFWTGETPPKPEEISDSKAYNRIHGGMWFLYGIGMPLSLCLGMTALIAEILGGIPLLIILHKLAEQKYRKQ